MTFGFVHFDLLINKKIVDLLIKSAKIINLIKPCKWIAFRAVVDKPFIAYLVI